MPIGSDNSLSPFITPDPTQLTSELGWDESDRAHSTRQKLSRDSVSLGTSLVIADQYMQQSVVIRAVLLSSSLGLGLIINNNNNCAAFENSDVMELYVIQCFGTTCRTGLEQVCLQVSCESCYRQWRKSDVWTGNSKVSATDDCGCPLHTEYAGGSRPQMSMSSKLNHRLAKLSQIQGCSAPQTLVDQHRDLAFYPLVNRKPVQIPQDWYNVVEFTCSSNQPCFGILNSLQLANDAVSSSNQ